MERALTTAANLVQVVGYFLPASVLISALTAVGGWVGDNRNIAVFATLLAVGLTGWLMRRALRFWTLSYAAQRAYEEMESGLWGEAARRMRVEKSPDAILEYMATGLIEHGVSVYGKYPPSKRRRLLTEAELKRYDTGAGGTILKSDSGDQFVDLVVERLAAKRAIKEMREGTARWSH